MSNHRDLPRVSDKNSLFPNQKPIFGTVVQIVDFKSLNPGDLPHIRLK